MSTANLPHHTALTQALSDSTRQGFFNRLAGWFRRPGTDETVLDGENAVHLSELNENPSTGVPATRSDATATFGQPGHEPRVTFLRNWGRRESAVDGLQRGLTALAELMTGIRQSLDQQSHRQDEILQCLSHLPEALRQLPESARDQAETLRAIHQQIEGQSEQHARVANILEKISGEESPSGRALDALLQQNASMSENLGRVSAVMQTAGANSESGARVLQQLCENIQARDGEISAVIKGQNTRLTTLLSAAVTLSVAALGAVAVCGYVLMSRMH